LWCSCSLEREAARRNSCACASAFRARRGRSLPTGRRVRHASRWSASPGASLGRAWVGRARQAGVAGAAARPLMRARANGSGGGGGRAANGTDEHTLECLRPAGTHACGRRTPTPNGSKVGVTGLGPDLEKGAPPAGGRVCSAGPARRVFVSSTTVNARRLLGCLSPRLGVPSSLTLSARRMRRLRTNAMGCMQWWPARGGCVWWCASGRGGVR